MKSCQYKVLLIEDDLVSCHFMKQLLKSEGIAVDAVGTGQKGIEKFEQNPNRYNLVMTDMELPDTNGIEIIKSIRRESKIPIVAISCRMNEGLRKTCLKEGAEEAYSKPLSQSNLAKIKSLLLKTVISDKLYQALSLYNKGYDRKACAQAMNVTENTFAWYLKKIRAKFNIRSRIQMMELEKKLQCDF